MDRDGMLRHLAFFEELGRMEETDTSWRAVSAGLVVMRLVDQWIADGPTASRVDSWAVGAVREAIAAMLETTPIKRILTSVVDVMTSSTAIDMHALCPRLMAYGQALEYEAKWSLAADVYATIVAHAHPVEDSDLAVAAHLQLAFCLRTLGDLDSAAASYADASRVAAAVNDMIGVLRGRLGDARIAIARGNMPHAEAVLDDTIARARAGGFNEIRAHALSDGSQVAGLRGHYERSIQLAYEALDISPSQRFSDRLLTNIATSFRNLGLIDVARDAYLVLAATAVEQYVRWAAELQLMELSANQGMELQFDKYRRELENAEFSPVLRITYLINVGRGYRMLGRSESGLPYLERAIELAANHRMNQLLFEAEAELANTKRRLPHQRPTQPFPVQTKLQPVISAIHEMKDLAGIA